MVGLAFAPFIRRLPSRCLPRRSQTGAQLILDLALQRPKQGLPPVGLGK